MEKRDEKTGKNVETGSKRRAGKNQKKRQNKAIERPDERQKRELQRF